MKKNYRRTDRVAEFIQRKLAHIIQLDAKVHMLPSFITISEVRVTADLEHAKVYFTVLDKDLKETAQLLNAAAGYLRSALAKSLTSRTVPRLHFIYDESIEYAKNLMHLIEKANSKDTDE